MASETTPTTTSSSIVPKACENCRARKVRCNRVIPCSNCLSSGISCRPAKHVEHRPRILVSNNYEKQIELISTRLTGIEHSLRSLSLPKSKESPVSQDDQTSSAGEGTPVPVQFEGLSSFQQQSIQATEIAESLGGSTTQELTRAIRSLKDLINVHPELPGAARPFSFTEMRTKIPQVELLPSSFVITVLKKIKERPSVAFMSSTIRDVTEVERICSRAYFPTEQISIGEQTAMFGLFYSVIQETTAFEPQFAKDYDCDALLQQCRRGFFVGIETYEMLSVPSYWNIVSLMMGCAIAMDERRSSLAFMLSNTACRHALALGYHREAILSQEEPEAADRKRFLFWNIYALDKSLSLTLGRASSVPEFDVDVEYFSVSDEPGLRPWDTSTLAFTKVAYVQGQVYEQLYSSSAAKKSPTERAVIIEHLSNLLHQYQEEVRSTDRTNAYCPEILDMLITPSEIVYYSLLTIMYRASTKPEEPEMSSQCFKAARKALEMHLEFFPNFTGDVMVGAYVNWILLYCSFTPFVVVFLHSIISQSLAELELLEKVSASLERIRFMAEDMEKLFQTCQTFCRVARTIIESRQSLTGTYDEQKNSFIFPDMTNSTLNPKNNSGGGHMMFGGAGSGGATNGSGGIGAGGIGNNYFQTHHLPDFFVQENGVPPTSNEIGEMSVFFGNWMTSNQPVMDLLNMDLALDTE